jgi:phage gp16-like protein
VARRAANIVASPETKRRRAIAKIHCAKRDLGLDDETYRGLLERVTGRTSAADLDERALGAVLDELRRLGFRSPRTSDPNQRPGEPQERLAIALWRDLERLGALDDPSERGLRKFAAKLAGVDSMQWADAPALNKVIEALKAWRRREQQRAVGQ